LPSAARPQRQPIWPRTNCLRLRGRGPAGRALNWSLGAGRLAVLAACQREFSHARHHDAGSRRPFRARDWLSPRFPWCFRCFAAVR
jgi:hypothetical protein